MMPFTTCADLIRKKVLVCILWKRVEFLQAKPSSYSNIPLEEDSSLDFLDVENFQKIPSIEIGPEELDEHGQETVAKKLNLEEIEKIQVLDDASAIDKVEQSLTKSGLHPGESASLEVTHGRLEIIPNGESTPSLTVMLDTQINYEQKVDGRRLIGPGAKMKFVLNDKGETTLLKYTARKLKIGPKIDIDPPKVVEERFRKGVGSTMKAELIDISCGELAYYAPPLSQEVNAIYPYYICEGKSGTSEESAESHQTMLPAISDLPILGINLETVVGENTVKASAVVSGGIPPYSYEWSSDATPLEGVLTTDSTLLYDHTSRSGDCQDRLHLTVTDGRGLRTTEALQFEVTGCDRRRLGATGLASIGHRKDITGPLDAGVEYINKSGGLTNSKDYALGFANCMARYGNIIRFKWGDYNAWESDWKDPVYGGHDTYYADNVDIALFSGRGSPVGLHFTPYNNDNILMYTEARYGNNDLEWLAIHAGEVLNNPSLWYNAFHGLHMMLGFKTQILDDVFGGKHFCVYMHSSSVRPALKIRQAWAKGAIFNQPSWVEYRMMGPIRSDGVSNINDYYHYQGSVGPDIANSQISHWWVITNNS